MVHPSLVAEGGLQGSRWNAVGGREAGREGGEEVGKEAERADMAQGGEGYDEREGGVRKALKKIQSPLCSKQKVPCVVTQCSQHTRAQTFIHMRTSDLVRPLCSECT